MLDNLAPPRYKGTSWVLPQLDVPWFVQTHGSLPFLIGDGRGANAEGGKWERGGDERRKGRGKWLVCKINE